MTIAEINRYIQGAYWRLKTKAQFDYKLADLIAISVGRLMSSNAKFPTVDEVYPDLFEEEVKQKIQEDKATALSTNNFMAWALQHNAQLKAKEDNNE